MASRDPSKLTPFLQQAWMHLSLELSKAGYEPIITCTYRSPEEQDDIYSLGRTKPGRKVTWLKGGQSKHNATPAKAFDIAIMVGGKLIWDPAHPCWKKARELGKVFGMKSLYPTESCHFEES